MYLSSFFSHRLLAPFLAVASLARAATDTPASPAATPLDPVVVYGRNVDLLGEASAASEGQVGAADLAAHPLLRRGELLEVVPGVVVTQHSGSGKANQYFLRGFNLDHGTDFAVSVDGLPVNLRTHAHGQGYSDLNFIIPELVAGVTYQKGQYAATNGDFSAAGAAQFHLVDALPRTFALLELGEDEYSRVVLGGTRREGRGAASTAAVEVGYANGPWVNPEHGRRLNLFLRQTWPAAGGEFGLTLMGYRGEWDSTDQIPARAVADGSLDRFAAVDPTDGGESERASLALDWQARAGDSTTQANVYAIRYRLNLFSDFTYFLDDPVNGDQFNQRDDRMIYGGSVARTRQAQLAGRALELTVGAQARGDVIDVGLFHTRARERLATTRDDDVTEASAALYAQGSWAAAEHFRVVAGWRADGYHFEIVSDQPRNSGRRNAAIASPKLSLVFTPVPNTDLYANAGYGFHSNDARGTTIRVDPTDGVTPVERVGPLVRARSVEAGLRTTVLPGLVSTVSVWALDLDSELVFVGDAGGTEASGATRRYGVEFANYYRPQPWLALDADLAFTHGRYRDVPPDEARIANSIATVITGGATVNFPRGWYTTARLRYFGPQPLSEDNSVIGAASTTVNWRLGWRGRDWEAALDVLNALDRANPDIAYYYTSRLPGEASGVVDDVHFHPAEPRTMRMSVTRRF